MDTDKRTALEQRRQKLQNKLQAEAYISQYLVPSLEVLDYFNQHGVAYRIAGLVSIPVEYYSYIEQAFTQPPYSDYGFAAVALHSPELQTTLQTIDDQFPSTNSFRYVPDFPRYADYRTVPPESTQRNGLQKAVEALELPDQPIYLYYLRYPLVLEVALYSLCQHDHNDLFNFWHGDAFIFGKDSDWLITFSLEEEWFGGRK